MSNISISWDNNAPGPNDPAGFGDDQIRSLKSNLQGALDAEHFFPSAGGNAGAHRRGSARAFVAATNSQISSVDTDGRFIWNEQLNQLYYASSTSTVLIGGQRAVQVGNNVNAGTTNPFIMSVDSVYGTPGGWPKFVTFSAQQGGFSGKPVVQATVEVPSFSVVLPVVTIWDVSTTGCYVNMDDPNQAIDLSTCTMHVIAVGPGLAVP